MKKSFLFPLMALFVLLFAACSQEEIVGGVNNQGPVTLSVNIPVNNPVTRAAPNIPDGFALRCIMQLVDANGNAIEGNRYVESVPSGSENVTFTFEAPEEYSGAMFWADYVKMGQATDINDVPDHLYTTTDLMAIGYNSSNVGTLFNNDAADAFAGYMLSGNNSITLKRPFTKLTFKSSDEAYKDYTKITVTDLPAPTGYNVMSGATAQNATGIQSGELSIAEGVWFSTFLFVGNNNPNMGKGNDINFTLNKESSEPGESVHLLIPGEKITLTENYNVTVDVTPSEQNETEVTVTFPDEMTDPTKPKPMAIGDYINKDGSFTKSYDPEQACGIIFAVGAQGDDEAANYGENLANKTIAGYAMALSNVAGKPFSTNPAVPGSEQETALNSYSGIKLTDGILKYITNNSVTSALFITNFVAWKENNEVTGVNLSSWYIPSFQQLATFIGHILGSPNEDTTGKFPTDVAVNNAFKTAVAAANAGELSGQTTKNVMSSSFTGEAAIACVQIKNDTEFLKAFSQTSLQNSAVMRPVLTVFKATE